MKKYINGIIVLLILSACGGGGQSSDNTGTNEQQTAAVTWESKFPSLWSVAYAADINPEDVTYDQFINTLAEKLKADTAFTSNVKGDLCRFADKFIFIMRIHVAEKIPTGSSPTRHRT